MRKDNRPRVLVIEEEEALRGLFASFLSHRSYSVVAVKNSDTALSIIKEEGFELVLLDINLSKMTGVDLLTQVREFNRDLKVFVFSGLSIDDEDMALLEALNVSKFISKPILMTELDEAIKKHIGAK